MRPATTIALGVLLLIIVVAAAISLNSALGQKQGPAPVVPARFATTSTVAPGVATTTETLDPGTTLPVP